MTLGSSTNNRRGQLPFSDLTVNTHVVSMTVTDEVGGQCVDDIIYTVGSAPPLCWSARPTATKAIPSASMPRWPIPRATGADHGWDSSIDGVFSTTGPLQRRGPVQQQQLTYGSHDITVTVTDSIGLYAQAIVSITVNGLPTEPTVTISLTRPAPTMA